jgi:hypothetical protein
LNQAADDTLNLIGYFYFPGRVDPGADGVPYNGCGLAGWMVRQKMGGPYHTAPIMGDRLQAVGSWIPTANMGTLTWTDSDVNQTVPSANHWDLGKGNVPTGGNFLFEDGSVTWYRFAASNPRATVDAGWIENGFSLFFKVPGLPVSDYESAGLP